MQECYCASAIYWHQRGSMNSYSTYQYLIIAKTYIIALYEASVQLSLLDISNAGLLDGVIIGECHHYDTILTIFRWQKSW